MKKIIPFLALLFFALTANAQVCTPVNCSGSLPAFGGICDTVLLNGRVNQAYSDFESFVITSSCFDAGLIDPSQAGNSIRITNVDNFTYTGLAVGITAASNANAYAPPNNGNVAGCVRFQGTPTQIGVFDNTINFLADVRLCTFPFISLNNNAAGYGLKMTVLPDPAFTGLASTYCTTDNSVNLTITGTTGGTFSGPGISGSTFNPATAGAGTHTIKYKVTRQEGAAIAPASDSLLVTVTVTAPGFTYYVDSDGDGYGTSTSIASCQPTAPTGYATQTGDCNDNNNAINPGAAEICDGIDNNCAGGVDNGLTFTTYYLDDDGDGYGTSTSISSCQPTAPTGYATQTGDCNDNNNAINPGATEICDGVDNNCAGGIDNGLTFTTYYLDSDGDGYGSTTSISSCQPTAPSGYANNNTDCDDADADINPGELEIEGNSVDENCDGDLGAVDADNDTYNSTIDCDDNNNTVYPGAPELCDGIDNNCVGGIDEGLTLSTYYLDADNDGYGSTTAITTCQLTPPIGYVANNTDCNDGNASINPGITEVCDGVDNNCAGGIDDGLPLTTYYLDADNDGYGNPTNSIVSCAVIAPNGYVATGNDCNDANASINPGATEVCDGVDNNCAGGIDDGLPLTTYYVDADNDTYGSPTGAITSCAANPPNGYVTNNTDCNDANANINPGATEICDGVDNNCAGGADEGLVLNTYYVDADNDTYGSPTGAITSCAANPPNGYVTNNTDCNDANANVNPGATEVCDGVDNNCNNSTDEGLLNTYYVDSDNDGYGSTVSITSCLLTAPSGYSANNTDCDDANAAVNPGAAEVCDGLDNNCNGFIDLADPNGNLTTYTYYVDADNDTYGSATAITSCNSTAPTGYVTNNTDCDDNNSAINPGATEVCDGIDNNCTNGIDEGLTLITYYRDADNDGYGNSLLDSVTCSLALPIGYVLVSGDCDDADNITYPGANEICDGIDNDCANGIDDGLSISTYYRDFDTDGFGDITQDSVTCAGVAPAGYVSNNQDCNDADLGTYPGATEIPNNGIDEDCNGSDLTVGLNTVEAQFGINLFPNPANDFIVLSGKLTDNLVVTIYDLQGKQLMSRALTQGTNYTLDIASLKAGYYMMEISNKTTAQRGFTRIVVVK